MPLKPQQQQNRRRMVAVEAARIMATEGTRDYRIAKQKAAARLNVHDDGSLPANREVEDALREHQRLFSGSRQTDALRERRESALDAMRFFASFEPRLVGTVLDGTADENSAIQLHLHHDHVEAVEWFLSERGIPLDRTVRRLRISRHETLEFPVYRFEAGDYSVDLTVLTVQQLRQAPLSRIDEKPMRRANLKQLQALLAEPDAEVVW